MTHYPPLRPPLPFSQMAVPHRRAIMAMLAIGVASFSIRHVWAQASSLSTLSPALNLYQQGRFLEAAGRARQIGGADGLALAARAGLATALINGASHIDRAVLAQAKNDATVALRIEPRHIEARLQLAVALGVEARRLPPLIAAAQGLPARARNIIEAVLADAPNNYWAQMTWAIWNLEAMRLGGSLAAQNYRASIAVGRTAFTRARNIAPLPSALVMEAILLLAINGPRFISDAQSLLADLGSGEGLDAFERILWTRGSGLKPILEARNFPAVSAMIRPWL